MFDAIIIGGGIVGMSAAYHAVLAGAKTLLIDRHDPGRATDAGAGILAPETNSRDGEAWFQFGIEAGTYYPHLIAQLTADNAGETGYARCGQLTVAVDEDEVPPLTEAKKVIFERQARRGTPEPAALHEVSSAEAQALFPALAETKGAIYYRDAARVDGRLQDRPLAPAAVD
jgi:D-amino-acid dehydrogenase